MTYYSEENAAAERRIKAERYNARLDEERLVRQVAAVLRAEARRARREAEGKPVFRLPQPKKRGERS